MQPRVQKMSAIEKVISILTYFTMGIAGLIYAIYSYLSKKKISFALMYNIAQSMVISIFLAILNLGIKILLQILLAIPFLSTIGIHISMMLQKRIIIMSLSFNIMETVIFLLLIYISLGVIMGRILYIPILTPIMQGIMYRYK